MHLPGIGKPPFGKVWHRSVRRFCIEETFVPVGGNRQIGDGDGSKYVVNRHRRTLTQSSGLISRQAKFLRVPIAGSASRIRRIEAPGIPPSPDDAERRDPRAGSGLLPCDLGTDPAVLHARSACSLGVLSPRGAERSQER